MQNRVHLGPKTVLFKEGEETRKLYLIKKGEVLCLKSTHDRLIPVFLAKEDDIIGESAMIGDNISTYSAVTLGKVELLEIPSQNFEEVLKSAPSWLVDLTTIMINRFQHTANLIAENRVIHPLIIEEDKFPSTLEVEFKKLLD